MKTIIRKSGLMPRRTRGQGLPRISFCLRITFCFFACAALLVVSCGAGRSEKNAVRYTRAGNMYAQGRFSETAALLEGIQNFPPAQVLRAKAEYFSGELEKAEKSCRAAIKSRPSAFEAKLYLVRILRDKGDASGAERLVESMLADNPRDIRTLRLASGLAQEMGKPGEASALLDQAVELSAECALVLLDRARLRWIAGMGTGALEDLARARAMLPWDTPLLRAIENLESSITEVMR
jgi:tetratricopeptide (TPR) repeat protein